MLRIISQEPQNESFWRTSGWHDLNVSGFGITWRKFCDCRSLGKKAKPTRGLKTSSEHHFGQVLRQASHCWHLCHPVAVLVYVLWKLRLPLPLITIIKIKWCLLCGNFPVPDRKKLPTNSSFSRAPSAGHFSEGTTSACLHLQEDAKGDFDIEPSIISVPGQVFRSTHLSASEDTELLPCLSWWENKTPFECKLTIFLSQAGEVWGTKPCWMLAGQTTC